MSVYPKLKYFEELSCGLTDSLQTSLFADVQIEVEGETFNCHRIILASMSHYFKTMFTSSTFLCSLFYCLKFFFLGGGPMGGGVFNKTFFQAMLLMQRLKLLPSFRVIDSLQMEHHPSLRFIPAAYAGTYFQLGNLIKKKSSIQQCKAQKDLTIKSKFIVMSQNETFIGMFLDLYACSIVEICFLRRLSAWWTKTLSSF